MENYIVLIVAILLEVAFRIIPTKVNISVIDKIKDLALMIHQVIDIAIPNKLDEK
jgi:hypothetical protein